MLSQRLFGVLYTGLIATLPLFSVRPLSGGLSLPLLFFIALAAAIVLHISITRSIPAVFSVVDHGICLYLFAALITLLYTASPEANFAISKSVIYFASYLGLKMALGLLTLERIQTLTRRGLILGTALITVVALVSLQQTDSFGIFSKGLNYSGVTVKVFEAIDTAFGQGRDSFRSVDVMRNAVAETFALYTILSLTLGFRSQVIAATALIANGVFTLGMFSRRALLAVGIAIFGGTMKSGTAVRSVVVIGILLIVGLMFGMETSEDSRLTDFTDEARTAQYSEALHRFASMPLLGEGYAVKLSTDKYVHNFVFGGMMMMGIFGLIATLVVFASVVMEFLRGLLVADGPWTSLLLIIPILGMSVGSTVEGIFTITGWVALALHDVCRRQVLVLTTEHVGQA